MMTQALMDAVIARVSGAVTVDEVLLIEGTPISYFMRGAKGIRAMIGYRGETPQRRNASSTTDLRAVRVAVSLMQTHSGRTSTPEEAKRANNVMDALVLAIEDTSGSPRWWTTVSGLCGVQLSEIQSLSSEEGDFTGRDVLFTFLVDANA